jgi:uncharacterized protein YecE (DUF72 family)
MKFGKVDQNEFSDIDVLLPPDSEITKKTLSKAKKGKLTPEIRIGGAKWGRKDWIGKLYPKGTKEKDFLEYYATLFDCIELNAMFYQLYPPATIEKWVEKVGPNFRFCPKFYQGITHMRRLKGAEELTSAFLKSVSAFGEKLGPSFMQLPDNYGPKHFDTLVAYLNTIPVDFNMFIEVRNKEWFIPEHAEKLSAYLTERNIGWAISDTVGRRDCVHMHLPTRKAFIRFVGSNLHPTDFSRTDEWARRIKVWMDSGIETIYYFIHQEDEQFMPELAVHTVSTFNKVCGLNLKEIEMIGEGTLFG